MHTSTHPTRWRGLCGAVAVLGLSLVMALVVGCGAAEGPPPDRDVRNPNLGLTITGLPPAWVVQVNENERLELIPSDAGRPGLVSVTAGPEEEGINLVASIDAHRAEIESREGGVYSGAQELSGPLGVAFYSRGRYTKDGATVEETRIVAIHPTASRLLVLDYNYPAADDSSSRVGELIELFALVE